MAAACGRGLDRSTAGAVPPAGCASHARCGRRLAEPAEDQQALKAATPVPATPRHREDAQAALCGAVPRPVAPWMRAASAAWRSSSQRANRLS